MVGRIFILQVQVFFHLIDCIDSAAFILSDLCALGFSEQVKSRGVIEWLYDSEQLRTAKMFPWDDYVGAAEDFSP
jgi:hypothetical protein